MNPGVEGLGREVKQRNAGSHLGRLSEHYRDYFLFVLRPYIKKEKRVMS